MNDESKKVKFIRVPEDMYAEIERHAKEQRRSIQMQTQILLGAALNRKLIYPESLKIDLESKSDELVIVVTNDARLAKMMIKERGIHNYRITSNADGVRGYQTGTKYLIANNPELDQKLFREVEKYAIVSGFKKIA